MTDILNVYGQAHPHDEVWISGDRKALISLRDSINNALEKGIDRCDHFASDGEGYTIFVTCELPKDVEEYMAPTGGNSMRLKGEPNLPWKKWKHLMTPTPKTPESSYLFFVSDYYATGEGRTVHIAIEMNQERDRKFEQFKASVGPFSLGAEELNEIPFMERYYHLVPNYVKKVLNQNSSSISFFQTYHFNNS